MVGDNFTITTIICHLRLGIFVKSALLSSQNTSTSLCGPLILAYVSLHNLALFRCLCCVCYHSWHPLPGNRPIMPPDPKSQYYLGAFSPMGIHRKLLICDPPLFFASQIATYNSSGNPNGLNNVCYSALTLPHGFISWHEFWLATATLVGKLTAWLVWTGFEMDPSHLALTMAYSQ